VKSVKTMLLGIAVLLIASFAMSLWIEGTGTIYGIAFLVFAIAGIVLCLKGYFAKDE
jgi:hypothetical protein